MVLKVVCVVELVTLMKRAERWHQIHTDRIHGTNGIFPHIWLIFMGNVGKYTVRPMDPMGYSNWAP